MIQDLDTRLLYAELSGRLHDELVIELTEAYLRTGRLPPVTASVASRVAVLCYLTCMLRSNKPGQDEELKRQALDLWNRTGEKPSIRNGHAPGRADPYELLEQFEEVAPGWRHYNTTTFEPLSLIDPL